MENNKVKFYKVGFIVRIGDTVATPTFDESADCDDDALVYAFDQLYYSLKYTGFVHSASFRINFVREIDE